MSGAVASLVGEELLAPVPPQAAALAGRLLDRFEAPLAVLFYGSILRTGDLDGVLDFYVLTQHVRPGLRGLATRLLWPDVSYHEVELDGQVLRAKVATMTLAQFQAATRGQGIDTTIWARFVQPAGLVWSAESGDRWSGGRGRGGRRPHRRPLRRRSGARGRGRRRPIGRRCSRKPTRPSFASRRAGASARSWLSTSTAIIACWSPAGARKGCWTSRPTARSSPAWSRPRAGVSRPPGACAGGWAGR
jgi:hypothetical protein